MKKRYAKKLMSATLASVMVMSMLSGCGSADSKSTEATEQTAEASTDEDIEIWSTNNGFRWKQEVNCIIFIKIS